MAIAPGCASAGDLVDNAVKYLGDQPHPRVEIGARRDGAEIVFYGPRQRHGH